MNAELKSKWVEALRSGRYVQGYGQLYYNQKYCCLGVLCSLMRPPDDPSEVEQSWDGWAGELGPKMAEEAGLTVETQCHLVGMNDELRVPFERIADYIEANL